MDIVIGFDVVENFRSGVLFVDEAPVLKHFVFEYADERLCSGIVIGVGTSRHTLSNFCLGQKLPVTADAKLTTSIAVKNEP